MIQVDRRDYDGMWLVWIDQVPDGVVSAWSCHSVHQTKEQAIKVAGELKRKTKAKRTEQKAGETVS